MRGSIAPRGRVVALSLALSLLPIVLVLHAPPVRDYVRAWLAEQATSQTGMQVSIKRLRYNLLTLAVEADEVTAAPPLIGSAPQIRIGRVVLELSWRGVLAGRIDVDRLLASDVDAVWASGSATVDLLGLTVRMERRGAGGLEGNLHLRGLAAVDGGVLSGTLTALDAALVFDGGRLSFDQLHLAGPGVDGMFAGAVDVGREAAPRMAARGVWLVAARDVCASWLSQLPSCDRIQGGRLRGHLRVDTSPTPVFSAGARSEDFLIDGTPIGFDGDAIVSSSAIVVPRLDVSGAGGRVELRSAVLDRATTQMSHAQLAWHGLDLRALSVALGTALPIAATATGRAHLAGDPREPTTLTGWMTASLAAAPGPGTPVAGQVDATLGARSWRVRVADGRVGTTAIDGEAEAPIAAGGPGAWRRAPLSGSARVASPDLSALVHVEGWRGSGRGAVRLAGTVGDPAVAGTVQLTAVPPLGDTAVEAAADVHVDNRGIRIPAFQARHGDDRFEGSFGYETRTNAVDAELTASVADVASVAELAGQPSYVRGRAVASIRVAGTAAEPLVQTSLVGTDMTLVLPGAPSEDVGHGERAIPLGDVAAHITRADALTVHVTAPDRGLTATGLVTLEEPRSFDVQVAMRDADLTPVTAVSAATSDVAGRIHADLHLRGDLAHPLHSRAELRLNDADVSVGGVRIVLANPSRLLVDQQRLAEASLTANIGDLAVSLERLAAADDVRVRIDGRLPPFLPGRDDAFVSVEGRVADERVELDRASLRWGAAVADATAQAPLGFLVNWLAGSRSGRLAADGPPARLTLEARSLPVASLMQAVTPGAPSVGGVFDLTLSATASDPALDRVVVDGRLERARVDAGGVSFAQQGSATLTVRDRVAAINGWHVTAPGADLVLRAASALGGAAPHFEAAAVADLDLGVLLKPSESRIGGAVHVDVTATGTPGKLTWDGRGDVRDAMWVSRAASLALTDVDAHVACRRGRCQVESMAGHLNGGTLAAEGELPLRLAGADGRLRIAVRGAGLEMPAGVRHDVDADLELGGGDMPRLGGTVTLWPSAVTDSLVELAALASSFQNGSVLEPRRDAVSAALSRVAVDVRIQNGTALALDGPDLRIMASADLHVAGTLAAPLVRGDVATLERGDVFLAGRKWEVETARISFLERPRGTEVRVDAAVSAQISKYSVRMHVSGPTSAPALAMTSDPPLGESDLAELVLTGSVTGGPQTRGMGQQVATLVTGELLTASGRAIGLDAVRVQQSQSDLSASDPTPVARLTVSKRLTQTLEVVYSQSLKEGDDVAWVLVLRPGAAAVDLRATIRTNGAEAYEVRHELEFGDRRRAAAQPPQRPPPPAVVGVDVEGVSPDDVAAVLARLSLATGDAYSAERWQRDRQAVTRYFHERDRLRVRVRASHVPAAGGGYLLKYDIQPGPSTRLDVRGFGADPALLSTLRDAWAHAVSDELLIDELTDAARLELASRGYVEAAVTVAVNREAGSDLRAVVDVSPARQARTMTIAFAANAAVTSSDLRRAIAERRVEPRCWLVPSLLEEPVVALYRARGYLAARAAATRVVSDGQATLTVQIDEGPRFVVGTLALVGTVALGERDARAGLALDAGAPFSTRALADAHAGLRTSYLRAGFVDAEIASSVMIRPADSAVDVTVTVTEGRPSRLEEIAVAGGEATSRQLVADVLDLHPGGPLDRLALDDAQQRLYGTGIFRTVNVETAPLDELPAAGTRPVRAVVTLEERADYRLRYGVQFGPSTIESITEASDSAEPGASVELQRRNLFGRGIVASGGVVWSGAQHRVRGTIAASTFPRPSAGLTFSIEHANEDRVAESGTRVIDRSARAVLEQRWRFGRARRVEVAYGFDIDRRHVEVQTSPTPAIPLEGQFAGFNTTITYDTRDNRFNPRRGLFHTSRIDAGADLWLSDVTFAKYQLQQFVYLPAGRTTFASGLRFGSLDVDDQREPAALLLFFKTGGGTSVRGYDTDSLTPAYVGGVPVGGKVLLIVNQELRVPVTRRIGIVGFADVGNTFEGLDTFGLGGLKVGVGSGLRIDTSVAVVRFDVAMPLPQRAAGPRARWYLSIGQAF